jgi:hypothetical protein
MHIATSEDLNNECLGIILNCAPRVCVAGVGGTMTALRYLCIHATYETLNMHSYDIYTSLPARDQITPAYLLLHQLIVSPPTMILGITCPINVANVTCK